jgi:transposase-like protein
VYIEEFKQSGLTQSAFCRKNNLHLATFSRWVRDLRNPIAQAPKKVLDFKEDFVNKSFGKDEAHFLPVQFMGHAVCPPSTVEEQKSKAELSKEGESVAQKLAVCASTPASVSLTIKGFCLDVPLDLAPDSSMATLKSLIHILHQLR